MLLKFVEDKSNLIHQVKLFKVGLSPSKKYVLFPSMKARSQDISIFVFDFSTMYKKRLD